MKTCPNCGYEPLNGELICPNCKAELKENIAKKISQDQIDHPKTDEPIENDNIEWSELKEVSLGEVMDQFHNLYEETSQEESTTSAKDVDRPERDLSETRAEEFEDDPILAAYLTAYKEGRHLEAQEEIKELIRKQEKPDELSEEKSIKSDNEAATKEDPISQVPIIETVETDETIQEESSTTDHMPLESTISESEELVVEIDEENTTKEEIVQKETDKVPTLDETVVVETAEALVEELKEEPVVTTLAEQKMARAQAYNEEVLVEEQETTIPVPKVESSTPKTSRVTRQKWSKRKKRIVWYTVAIIAIVSVSGGAYYAHEQKLEQEAQALQVKRENSVAEIDQKIKELSFSTTEPFVKSTADETQLLDYQKQLSTYSGVKEQKQAAAFVSTLLEQISLQKELNAQFNEPIISDGKVNQKAYVLNTQTYLAVPTKGDTDFDTVYNQAVTLGQKQVEQAQKVKESVAKQTAGLKDGKLTATITNESYTSALKQVDALQDATLKAELTKELAPIKTALAKQAEEEKAKEEKAKQEAEAQAAAKKSEDEKDAMVNKIENTTQFSQASQILSPSTPVNKDNRPIIASRQSDLDNTSSAAWQWADGVYDNVINTCIQRGYIVPGGYYLERVRIENGQGYYNLYATNAQSSLLKGTSEKALPMYIATINDKTGFFKGNGGN